MRLSVLAVALATLACSSKSPGEVDRPVAAPAANAPEARDAPNAPAAQARARQTARFMNGSAPDDGAGYAVVVSSQPITASSCGPRPSVSFHIEARSVENALAGVPIGEGDDRAEVFVCSSRTACEKADGTVDVIRFDARQSIEIRYDMTTTSGAKMSGTVDATWLDCANPLGP